MKRLLLIAILLLSLLATGVSAAIDLTATSEPIVMSTNPGSALNGQFTVHNSETIDHTVAFSGYSLTHTTDSSKHLNIDTIASVAVTTGTSQNVNFAITQTNVYAGTYAGALVGTSTTNSALTDNIQFQITVNPNPSATVNSPTFSAGRGISRTHQDAIVVTNTGNTDLNAVSIILGALSDGTNTLQGVTISPNSANINYHDSNTNIYVQPLFDITTNIPIAQPTGTYTGTFTVNQGSNQLVTGSLSITVRDPIHEVQVSGNEINLGSATQPRSQTIQHTFDIQNTGDYSEPVTLALSGVNSNFNAQLSTTQLTLEPGQTRQVTVSLTIPDSQDSGKTKIGNVALTYNQQTTNLDLNLETESMLSIEEVETQVDDESSNSLGDGDTISDEAKPGDEVEFEIKIKNLFSSSEDIKIEDITIEIIPDNEDFDEVEIDSKFDLNADKTSSVKTLVVKVPSKFNEGEYDFDIIVEGEDENNALHTVRWTVTLEVEKENHDLRIDEIYLGTDTLQCVKTTDLKVTIANFGAEDQDEAALAIYSQALGINVNVLDIYLDADYEDDENEFTKTVTISVPDNFAAGSYPINIKVFRDTDNEMDSEIVYLKVENCPAPEPVEPDTTVVITPPTGTTDNGGSTTGSSTNVVDTVEASFTNSLAFILILVGLDLIALVVILVLVFKFLF